MKSIILVACLILSANAAPQKTIAQAPESQVKSEKLQFSPADAQVYTSALPKVAAVAAPAVQTVDQLIAGNAVAVPQQVYSTYDQVIPAYYNGYSGANVQNVYQPGVVRAAVYPGDVPYYSAGRSTATTITGANGLPAGTVYEHQGTTHFGHSANAVHIKRQGQWFNPSVVGSPLYAPVAGVGAVAGAPVPAHLIPAHLYATQYEGQTQFIGGQPAQKVNGQWYYITSAIPSAVNPLSVVSPQYTSVYTNLRSNVQPVVNRAFNIQPDTQYTSSVVGYAKPSVQQDNKWYTKTNTQQIAQPFWSQGQVVQQVAATGTKNYAVPKPEAAEEKADW